MEGASSSVDIFAHLDGSPIVGSWRPDLSRALLELDASLVPVDRQILSPLCEAVARNASELSSQARLANPASPMRAPTEIHEDHPASSTLFSLLHSQADGLQKLVAIGFCALLTSSEVGRREPRRLLASVRGGLGPKGGGFSGALGAIGSIPELVRIIETDSLTRATLPKSFMSLWDSWLHDTLVHWMLADIGGFRYAFAPTVLVPDISGPQVLVAVDPDKPDESVPVSGSQSAPAQVDGPYRTEREDRGRAEAMELDRRSVGDLFAPADFRLPAALDRRICQSAVKRANEEFARSPQSAEPFIGLGLLLGGGLREIDLPTVVWGGPERARPFSVAIDAPVLYRSVKRPGGAVEPPEETTSLMERTSDVLPWPLPPSVHKLLLRLAEVDPTPGLRVLPGIGSSRDARDRMHRLIQKLVPEANVGALAPRFVLASEIAAALGSDMAQLAMSDTFGMSPIPCYYSAMPEAAVAQVIADIQSSRFGETVPVPIDRGFWLGSRLTLTSAAARLWPDRLRMACRDAEKAGHPVTVWKAHRDHLAGALCSATGHRPEDALGQIHLADVIPEYGLIVLQDKQVDALRSARIAATGKLWLSELRRYLDRLSALARERAGHLEGDLAAAILRSEAPLFTVVNACGEAVALTATELRQTMPPELSSVDNFFRHRLNQRLLAKRADPELRHAQMGWVVTSAHLFADLSPRPPTELGASLGATIDEVLVGDGWYLPSARKLAWTWDGIPMPAPVDWEAAFRTAEEQHREAIKQVRARLKERWKSLEASVIRRMADAFREFCPRLELDPEKPSLRWAPDHHGLVDLTADHHALICDRVRMGDQEPGSALEAIMARIILYRMVRRARYKQVTQGPIPSRPILRITSDPSPFVPGLGAAVRQAFLLRSNLQLRAANSIRDLGVLTAWSILAHSIYRRRAWAQAATGAARTLVRAASRGHAVRVFARTEDGPMHMVFSGIAATLLARRKRHAPTSPAPSDKAMDAWAFKHLASGARWGESKEAARLMESALLATARVELSGLERLLARVGGRTAAEVPLRCVARDDAWPAQTAVRAHEDGAPTAAEPGIDEPDRRPLAAAADRRGYGDLVELLNKRSFSRLRKESKGGRRSSSDADDARSWRRKLGVRLRQLSATVEDQPNLKLLVDYALDHLRYGSEAGNQLEHRSLHREVTQIGWPLLVLAADRPIALMIEEELIRLYRELLLSKTPKGRPYVLEELRRFHGYLVRVHTREPIDWGELAAISGPRQLSIEPALVTPSEIEAIEEALESDYRQEAERPDASPDFLRLAQLRRIYFIVLEASGIRPGSAYGLTIDDIHTLGTDGDFVHVRRGGYGEAKTDTSLGFVPLTGPLWNRNRQWVQSWLAGQKSARGDLGGDTPLFASKPAGRSRVHEHHLTKRLNQLLKWATGYSEASCYWLRKTRITERLHELAKKVSISARDMYGALIVSGHAWIEVTVERYVNDPCCLMAAELVRSNAETRAALLAYSGIAGGALDVAWHRAAALPFARSHILLDRLRMDVVARPNETKCHPPALRRFSAFLPMHLDAFARALHDGSSREEAALLSGITKPQADAIQGAAKLLYEQRQCTPWRIAKRHTARELLEPPRRLHGTETWLAQLETCPSSGLLALADAWATQPFVHRLFGDDVLLRLDGEAIDSASRLIDETRIGASVIAREGRYLVVANAPEANGLGHAAAMRWVLALVWIHARTAKLASTAATASEAPHPGVRDKGFG